MAIVNEGRPYNRRGKPLKKVRKRVTIRKKKTDLLLESSREYDFLKWIRIIFKWALAHSKLSKGNLDMILHFYSHGPFTRAEYSDYYSTIGSTRVPDWDKMIRDGWIREWRAPNGGRKMKGLFDLTSRSKILCCKIYKMCIGDMDIPVTRRSNPLNRHKEIKVNAEYTRLFKKMNAERALKRKKKEEEDE